MSLKSSLIDINSLKRVCFFFKSVLVMIFKSAHLKKGLTQMTCFYSFVYDKLCITIEVATRYQPLIDKSSELNSTKESSCNLSMCLLIIVLLNRTSNNLIQKKKKLSIIYESLAKYACMYIDFQIRWFDKRKHKIDSRGMERASIYN